MITAAVFRAADHREAVFEYSTNDVMNPFRKLMNKALGVAMCAPCDAVLGQYGYALVCPYCKKPILRNHPPETQTRKES